MRAILFVAAAWVFGVISSAADLKVASQQFRQEIARHREVTNGLPAGPVKFVVTANGKARVLAGEDWVERDGGAWKKVDGPKMPEGEAIQLFALGGTNYFVTEKEIFSEADGIRVSLGWPGRFRPNSLAFGPDGIGYLGSTAGLHRRVGKTWEPLRVNDGLGRSWATTNVLATAVDSTGKLWLAMKAGVVCRDENGWRFFEGKDGLPWNDFTCATAGPDGEVWFGTHLGAILWDGKQFHYRQGFGWLPNDDIRAISVDAEGSVWFATAGGVGMIERRKMTLAEKAEIYESEIEKYIERTPFDFVAEAPLKIPGDKSSAAPTDSDNDGLWTAMYGAGECFAFSATKDSKAKARAEKAFEALRFLQKITQGGEHPAPKGYVARTVRPTSWPDPNIGRLKSDLEDQKGDELWKAYEPRWPKSADGQWFWKGDTSSDELDGHYFFYALYYDFVADSPAEKDRVREVVRDLTDHLIAHDFTLVDIDGKPTRWGMYNPKTLSTDPRWWVERGLNSLSMLTYLSVAEHVTGDPKYAAAARDLIDKHGYAQNLMFPKAQFGPGSGNQSDDEMAIMCYYTLLRCSKDEKLKNLVRYSYFTYWTNEAPEMNPFFNYAYAAHALDQNITNLWGTYNISPWVGWQEDSIATLRGFPLDRLNWPHKNSHRLDIVKLGRQKSKDLYEAERFARGHLVNGKVLPVENRHFNHWNTDPWDLDYGGGAQELAAGTVFLLPYYMGLHHGYIAKQ